MNVNAILSMLGRGAALKLVADLGARLLQYVLLWLAARQLAPTEFGDLAFALGIGYTLAQVADFGLQLSVQRELARLALPAAEGRPYFADEQLAGRLVGGGLVIKAALSVPVLGIFGALLLVEPLANKPALLAIGVSMLLASGLEYLAYCFRALHRLQDEAAAIIAARGSNLLLGALLLAFGTGVGGMALASNLAMLGGVYFAYRRLSRYLTPLWRPDWAYWRGQLHAQLWLGLGIVFSMLAFRLDILLIPPLVGREALGVYSVAYKMLEPCLILPAVVLAATFPRLAKVAVDPIEPGAAGPRGVFGQTLVLLLTLGLGATGTLALLAGPLIDLLYGPSFAAAAPLLVILALALLPMYLNYGLTHMLIAADKSRLYALFMLAALFANMALNMVLLPLVGVAGAAVATVATELLLLLLCAPVIAHLLSAAQRASTNVVPQTRLEGTL